MMSWRGIIVALGALWLGGCTAIGTSLANLPTYFDDVRVVRDVVYDPEHQQKMDIYQPSSASGASRGVIVFFYGGRWTSGSKDDYAFVGSAFARQGYVVVIPDYRKYPDVRFPVFAQDAAKAVAWVARMIGDYGGDSARIYVAGHSSGAHMGALIASDPRYLRAEGQRRDVIKAFAGLAGPYAFIPEEDDLKDMFGPPDRYAQMQAPTFIDGSEPPMLLLWGQDDTAVGEFNLDRLRTAIRDKNGCVATRVYPGVDHVWIVGGLSWLGRDKAPVLADITDFFTAVSKNSCPDVF